MLKTIQTPVSGDVDITITIPEGVTSISNSAFDGCEALTSVVIPDTVTLIGRDAFLNCYNLTSVSIGANVTTIRDDAFWGCRNLRNLTFEGTTAQWNAVSLGETWVGGVPATDIICSDGSVPLF